MKIKELWQRFGSKKKKKLEPKTDDKPLENA